MTVSSNNKKTSVVIGLDISTSTTGISVINQDTEELVLMHHETMINQKKYPTFWSKVEHMKNALREIHDPNWDVQIVAVEESMKRFSPGFSSASTLFTLAKFNGILSYICIQEYGVSDIHEVGVRTARSKLGIKIDSKDKSKTTKQKVLEKVIEMNPDFPWIKKTTNNIERYTKVNEDRADSWVIAAAAHRIYSGKK